jgi:superfamily II DNA or RNA helicase
LVYVGKRHQVENGVLSGNEYTAPEFFDDPKIEKILDYAIEFPRMVIFAKYRLQIVQIEKALKKAGKKVYTLTGETKDRGAVIAAAAKEKECVFVAQAQVSAGWELKEYPVMIFASRTNSFVDFEQAKGRIQRADNIKKNLYIKLLAKPYRVGKKIISTVDDAQDFSLENKQDFDERLYAKQ